jgi:hypothetical protein
MTSVKLNKKSKDKTLINELPPVFKLQRIVVELGADYEQKVNESLVEQDKTPDFTAGARKWGVSTDAVWVVKDDKKYVKVIEIKKDGLPNYVHADFTEIDYDNMKPFMPVIKPSTSPSSGIKFRTYGLDSIIDVEPFVE